MNGMTYTIAQALASPLSNLQVVDTAADIANALPDPDLTSRVTSFSLSANGALSAALADRLAVLGPKYNAAGFLLTVSDTLADLLNPANAAGLALAAARQVVDNAADLLSAPGIDFAHVTSVVLTGDPTLTVAQLAALKALPNFSIQPGAHVTLSDSLANIGAMATAHPAWLTGLGAVTARLDGSQITGFAAVQLEAFASHGGTLTFTPSGGDSTLNIVALDAPDLALNAAALRLLSNTVPLAISLTNNLASLSAASAAALATLPGFTVSAHTLFVADSGANIGLQAAHLFGQGFAEIIVASGTFAGSEAQLLDPTLHFDAGAHAMLAQSATLGAAAVSALASLPGFSRATGVTLTVADTAANLLAQAGHLVPATALQVTNSATVSAAGANTLATMAAGHPGAFSLQGHTLTVADTAANLLALSPGALALAGATQLTAGATLSVLQAQTLLNDPAFTSGPYAVTLSDTAANLLNAHAGVFVLASATQLSADASISASQAEALATAPGFSTGGHALTISDDIANLLALPAGLKIDASVLALGAAQSVSAAQLTALLSFGDKFNEEGHLLSVADSAASLVGLSAPALALAGAASLTQSAIVSAAGAATLAGLTGFSLAPDVTLTVQDSVANLLALPLAALAIATQELLPMGAVTLTAMQAADLVALGNFSAAGATITVADSVANLTSLANATWPTIAAFTDIVDTAATLAAAAATSLVQTANAVTLSGNAQIDAAQAAELATIPHFSEGLAQLTVVDGAAAIAAAQPAITSLGVLAEIDDSETIDAAQAASLGILSQNNQLVLFGGDRLTLADTAQALLALAPGAVALASAVQLTADAVVDASGFLVLRDTLHASPDGHSITISDNAENLLSLAGGNLTLATACWLSGAATVSAMQAETLLTEPGFGNGGYLLTVADSAAALLALPPDVLAVAHATQLTAPATVDAADAASLAALPTFSEANGATLTVQDSVANLLALPLAAQAIATLELLPAGAVTLTAMQAAGLVALGHFSTEGATITVADSVANLTLVANAAWPTIAAFTDVIDTAATLAADASTPLVQNANEVTLSANAQIDAAQAAELATIANFSEGSAQLTVVDGAAAIAGAQAAITSLGVLAEIDDTETVTTAQADALAVLAAASQLAFLGGHSLTVSGSYAILTDDANAAGVALASQLIVTDTAANLVLAAAHDWGTASTTFDLSQGDTITAAQATTLAGLGNHFNNEDFVLQVADNAGDVAAIGAALTSLGITAAVVDSAANIAAYAAGLAALGNELTAVTIDDANPIGATQAAGLAPFAAKLGLSVLRVADNAANTETNLPALDTIENAIGAQLHLAIADSAANIGPDAADFAAIGATLAVTLTDVAPVSAATAIALLPLDGDFSSGTVLNVTDTGAMLATDAFPLEAIGNILGTITLADGTTQTAAIAAALLPLDNHLGNGVQLTATGSVAQLLAVEGELLDLRMDGRLAGVVDALDGAESVANNSALLNDLNATVTISDNAADVAAYLDPLALVNHLTAITLTGGGTPILTVNLASLTHDGAVLAVITGPFQLNVADTGAAISADLASGESYILSYLDDIASITSTLGGVSLTQTQILAAGVDSNPGDALTLYSGPLDVTGVDADHLTQIAGLPHAPTTIEVSDTAMQLTGNFAALLANVSLITSIAVSDHGAIALTATQVLAPGADDGPGSVFSKITGGTLTVSHCSLAQLPLVEALPFAPSSVAVSDTAAAIMADLAFPPGSVLIADLANISSITISDAGTVSLTEGQALVPGVDNGPGSVLAKMSGGGFTVTGVAAGDVAEVLGLYVAPGHIGISDTATAIAGNLAALVAALGKITTITVTGGTLTLTAMQAETAGVADGAHSVIGDIAGHAFDVDNVTVAQLAAVAGLAETPSGITISDSSAAIAGDLALENSTILASFGLLTGIFVTGGTLSLTAATALPMIDASSMNPVAALLAPGEILQITGVALADLATIAAIDATDLTIQVADTAANVVADLESGHSLLEADIAVVTSVTLTQGDTLNAADMTALAGYPGISANEVMLTVEDNAAAIATLGEAARALATNVVVVDSAADVTLELNALQAAYDGHLSIDLTDMTPSLMVTAATYVADRATLDAITTPATVTVTGSAASIADPAATLSADPAVAAVDVTDSAADIVSNLASLLALGSKLTATLTDVTPLTASLLAPLLQIAQLDSNGVGVADTGSQIASLVESGNAAAITFLNTYGATLTATSYIGVADVAALGQLTDFSKNGFSLIVWDTAAHLTAPGAASILASPLIDAINLKATGDAVTLTAATTVALFAIPGFNPANPYSSGNLITVSDSAAHIDAVHAALAAIGVGVAQIVVNASATITDAVLGDLQALGAVAAFNAHLTVRDTAANIDANALAQASGQSVTPVAWQLSGSATLSEANAVILGNLANFSAGPYTLTLSINADTAISISDANALGNIGAALRLNGYHLLVDGTVAQLSTLSEGALAIVAPQLTDSFGNINALSLNSPLLTGTVTVDDAENVSATQVAHFLGLLNGGSGPGINPAHLSFDGQTESVVDNVGALQALTASTGWTGNTGLHASFQLSAVDTVVNLINGANLSFLEGLHATTLVADATSTAAQAETLATIANEINFTLGDNTLTISDTAANLLNSANADGLALATTLTLSGPDTVGAEAAETLLTTSNFVLSTELTISDSSANLLDGTLVTDITDSPYASHIEVQLDGPETLDAQTAEALVSLPGFDNTGDLSIADSSSYLLDSANLTAEQLAVSVTLAGNETVSANTVLRLSEVPHFNASGGVLTLSGNDFANAATLKAVADLGTQFNDGGHTLTVTQDVLDLTPTEFSALASDGIVANGHLLSAELIPATLTDVENVLSLTAAGVAGSTVDVYGQTGTLLSATVEANAGFTVTATDGGSGSDFSVTELVNGVESAPVVILEAGILASAVTTAGATFASSGQIEVAPGEYLNLYTTGSVPVLTAPALVYNPSAHTVSLDIPGSALVTLITLGAATHPATLDVSEILVKHHG